MTTTLAALRTTPDKGAPNGIPVKRFKRRSLFGVLAALAAMPFYAAWYYLANPGVKTLKTYLFGRALSTAMAVNGTCRDAETWDEAATTTPDALNPATKELYASMDIAVVTVPPSTRPQEAYTLGPATVKPAKRPGFIVTPAGARGSADAKAAKGEKLLFYLHGG